MFFFYVPRVCRIVQHGCADAELTVFSFQDVMVDTSFASFPESLVVCQFIESVVHFDFPHDIPAEGMLKGLNSMLPLDCEVVGCEIVPNDFHARFTTHGKRYMYRVSRGRFTSPFKRFYTGHYKYPLDIEKIKEAMPDLVGTHDFSSFVASGSQTKNHVRTIYEATVREDKENDEIIFEFCGNGFLYNQVRIMVATLLEIGNGKRPVHDFLRLYEVKDRNECRETAPASGLYLKEVYYD